MGVCWRNSNACHEAIAAAGDGYEVFEVARSWFALDQAEVRRERGAQWQWSSTASGQDRSVQIGRSDV